MDVATNVTTFFKRIGRFRSLMDANGQDLVDYALIAGFLVVVAGAVSPMVADRISQVYGKLFQAISTSQGSSAK
jgi:Flp pilus assembly pilin Flp